MKNKTKKKRNRMGWIKVVLVTLAILLAGCQSGKEKEQKTANVETAQRTSFPESYQYTGERVVMNIETIEPGEAYFINGTAMSFKLDGKSIGRMFMPEDGTNVLDEERRWILSEEMVDDAHNEIFMWGDISFSYTTYQTNKLADSIRETKDGWDYNLPVYKEKKEFSFGTAEEALEEIMIFLEKAGIQLGENYKADIFYLDYETLREQERYYDPFGNVVKAEQPHEWSEADNAYLFYIHQTYCELEDYHHNRTAGSGVAEDFNSQITVIYNAEGIVKIHVGHLSTYTMDSTQEELLDFETIADKVSEYFDYMLGDSTYEIDSAQLVCKFEEQDYNEIQKIIPVWSFHVTETMEDGSEWHYEKWFHAVTGECIN